MKNNGADFSLVTAFAMIAVAHGARTCVEVQQDDIRRDCYSMRADKCNLPYDSTVIHVNVVHMIAQHGMR